MALINCSECNNQISDKALSCPHCGIPRSKTVTNVHNSVEFVDSSLKESKQFFSKSFWISSTGRISRSQYIIGMIVIFLAFLVYVIVINYLSNIMLNDCSYGYYEQCFESALTINIVLKLPLAIFVLYILTVLSIKRFHDICKNGYQVFLLGIPIIGFYYLWILLSEKGNNYTNMYGEP